MIAWRAPRLAQSICWMSLKVNIRTVRRGPSGSTKLAVDDLVIPMHASAHRKGYQRNLHLGLSPAEPPALRKQAESSSTGSGQPSHDRQPDGRPSPERGPAGPARALPRSGGSWPRVRRWGDSFRGRSGDIPDAWDRCRPAPPKRRLLNTLLSGCCRGSVTFVPLSSERLWSPWSC